MEQIVHSFWAKKVDQYFLAIKSDLIFSSIITKYYSEGTGVLFNARLYILKKEALISPENGSASAILTLR